jgi:hypothetical protein
MIDIQFYKQPAGAVDVDGSPMEPGWYYVRMRYAANGPPIPFGKSIGPFSTKALARKDASK